MSPLDRPARTAFLLAQVGSYAAARFADQVRPLGLTPAGAGLLRVLSRSPGLSQRALADRLGAAPSRVVVLLDALEGAGLVARTRDPADRRHHQLDLTDAGRTTLAALRDAAEAQTADVLGPLDDAERAQLAALVTKLANAHGLDPEIHLDFRRESNSASERGSTPAGPGQRRPPGSDMTEAEDHPSVGATVREWRGEEGWGVLDSLETPGGCWAHFSVVNMVGYRELQPGQNVQLHWEKVEQDGYHFRAVQVLP